MTQDPDDLGIDLDLTELAENAGVTPRTVRYYVQQGLLPSPGTRGPGTKYDRALVDRLQMIKLLQKEHWPLAKIRSHLEALDDEGVGRDLEHPPVLPLPRVSDSALRYLRGVLEHDRVGAEPTDVREPSPFNAHRPPGQVTAGAEAQAAHGKWQVTKSTWERIRLTRDVELSIRRPLTREQNRLVDRLLEAARNILSEET